MKLDAFDASSSARPRISDVLPIRPSGMTAFHSASASGEVGPPPPRFVLNGPGAIAFTRTFHRARSWAACLVKLITAALAIVYEYGVYGSFAQARGRRGGDDAAGPAPLHVRGGGLHGVHDAVQVHVDQRVVVVHVHVIEP